MGPLDSCGTPDVTGGQLMKVWLMQTLYRHPANQFRIHWAELSWMPLAMAFMRILSCGTLSNAF